ncbi:unnamed protein product [Meloidogyne enterolobii]|uniref:Uncharacterized protein n=1 Tax=Meloidogyne enterolobii TaxID=390850 RepID=A0ACB1A5Y6_MELEN
MLFPSHLSSRQELIIIVNEEIMLVFFYFFLFKFPTQSYLFIERPAKFTYWIVLGMAAGASSGASLFPDFWRLPRPSFLGPSFLEPAPTGATKRLISRHVPRLVDKQTCQLFLWCYSSCLRRNATKCHQHLPPTFVAPAGATERPIPRTVHSLVDKANL